MMPSKTKSILIGAAVSAILSVVQVFLSVNGGTQTQSLALPLCCLTAVAGAGTAVWHYTTTHRLTIPAGTGAGLGAGAVAGGYLAAYLISKALQAVGVTPSDAENMERARQQLLDQGMDQAMIDQSMQMAEALSGPAGTAASLGLLAVLGAIGGAIAAAVFKRGEGEDYEV